MREENNKEPKNGSLQFVFDLVCLLFVYFCCPDLQMGNTKAESDLVDDFVEALGLEWRLSWNKRVDYEAMPSSHHRQPSLTG